MSNKSKCDTAIWSTKEEMISGLSARGRKFVDEKRPVRINHRSGRVLCGIIKGFAPITQSAGPAVDFIPTGSQKVERIPIDQILQFSVMSMPFGHELEKNNSRMGGNWM